MKVADFAIWVLIVGLIWVGYRASLPTPPSPDPEPSPVVSPSAPVIDIQQSVSYQNGTPDTSRFWVWFTDADTVEDENGSQTWLIMSGPSSGNYDRQHYTHNLIERQSNLSPGIWFCIVEDYQGNRSAEVVFQMNDDGTIEHVADPSNPNPDPDPTPDPDPGPEPTPSVRISWAAPTESADGTQLTYLAGYKVYWGPSSQNYISVETLPTPETQTLSPWTFRQVRTFLRALRLTFLETNQISLTRFLT